jgi:galactose mutarotase-like enzyme
MYLALVTQGFARMRRRLWHEAVMRSGGLTMLVLTLVLVGLAFGWREHRLGQFGQIKRDLKKKPLQEDTSTLRPGGQDAILLQRSQFGGGSGPEFLSATLLPGRGMNVLQITAYLPDKGEVSLLASPSLGEATRLMNGTGTDAAGAESLEMGGAIEAPWAGRISGTPSADGKSLTTVWHGRHLSLPVADPGTMATGGLLLKRSSAMQSSNVMPDGGEAKVGFHAGDFNGHWVSQTDITTTVELSGRAIEMTVQARNSGTEAEPMGIGWQPRFAILSGNRAQATLRLPIAERVEVADRRSGLPSGRLLPVKGTEYDFTELNGARLGSLNLDDSFVHLKPAFMDNGPVAELRDPDSDYGLRITAMTSNIKAMRVYAPAGAKFISIDPQFNFDDPFGHEWAKEDDTGMVVLQPGQTVQWKIRLEIFSLTQNESQHL